MESYRRVCVIIIYFYASLMYFYASEIFFSNLNVLLYICVLYLSIIIIMIVSRGLFEPFVRCFTC